MSTDIRRGYKVLTHDLRMANEQRAWWQALSRPRHDATAVEGGLVVALRRRGLDWSLRAYQTVRDAKKAWDAWPAWTARDAGAALTAAFASVNAWVKDPPDHLTAGLREAYENGLGVVIPTLPNVLGWAMDPAHD